VIRPFVRHIMRATLRTIATNARNTSTVHVGGKS